MAEQRLLTHEYQNTLTGEDKQWAHARMAEGEANEKGPIIVCIDTSGSMRGPAETYAKTVAYALAKVGLEEGRPCEIVAFSRRFKSMEVSRAMPLDGLLDFLAHSFHGGTDPTYALHRILQHMKSHSAYRWADLLMVSDFQMHPFSQEIIRDLETARKRGNRFYALLTGIHPFPGILNHFDRVWKWEEMGG